MKFLTEYTDEMGKGCLLIEETNIGGELAFSIQEDEQECGIVLLSEDIDALIDFLLTFREKNQIK